MAFNTCITASNAAIVPIIHVTDYNRVNTGFHPITAAMLFPNDTTWRDPDVECLIITDQAFVATFEPLANLKTSRGVYTIIITVQSIYIDTRFISSGPDHAAWIRNAIKHYHDHNNTEFVILGGDVNIIPIRYVYNPDTEESSFPSTPVNYRSLYKPTDHYYACLEGTWDADNDGKFGEMGVVGTSGDEVDWTAEVFVGRIPANNISEAQIMVQKIIDYETNPPSGTWLNTAVFAGAVSQYENPVEGTPSVDEAELSEFMIDSYFAGMANKRIYQVSTSYTPPSPYTTLTMITLRNAWNQGSSIINLAGHGNPGTFGGYAPSYTTYLTEWEAKNLTNGGKLPLAYIFSCSSGAFDYKEIAPLATTNCLSEELVLNANGGAIAVVSALRTTYYFTVDPLFEALNEGQNRFFWREFMVNREYQPGRALYLSQESYIKQFINKYWNVQLNHDPELAKDPSYIGQEEKFRKNLLTYNLLGDPEISIYTNTPREFATDIFGQNASIGDTLVVGIVDNAGMPVPNARVLVNGSGYYIVARANAQGIASVRIPHDPALVGKYVNITLSGHNMKVARDSILLIEDTQPPASLHVDVPSEAVDYRGSLVINASGIDAGSGLRYAFIVVVDETGNTAAIHAMARTRVDGNGTSFKFKYPGALPPGETIRFYVVAFDASGNYVIATPTQNQFFTVSITSRLVEEVMVWVLAIGTPAAFVLILLWFFITRRQRIKRPPVID
ncbi:MAG: C25 family cysteine peptidase [Candidatus Sigynarchaeum springense]